MEHNHNGLVSYSFSIFESHNLQVEVLSRKGGVSQAPWDSLNLGSTVGDKPENVKANLMRVCEAFNIDNDNIYDVWQVHSANNVYTNTPRQQSQAHQKADIILTDKPGLNLLMRFADCVPLFIYDPISKAVAIGHAGWQGTVKNVAGTMVRAMTSQFSSNPEDLLAAIGPAICMEHYQVGSEVIESVQAIMKEESDSVIQHDNGMSFLDLKKANELQFRRSGVLSVENSGICTFCNNENWFSHRKGQGITGRFGAFIKLLET